MGRAEKEQQRAQHTDCESGKPWYQKKPTRAEDQQEAQVAPAVSPTAQMGRAAATIFPQRCRHLADFEPGKSGFHDHLAGKLHAGRLELQVEHRLTVVTTQPTVEVFDRRPEECPTDPGEHGIAEILVQRRHRPGLDPSPEAVAHDELVPRAQTFHERIEIREVVAVVSITHDDVAAMRRFHAADECRTIALHRNIGDARAVVKVAEKAGLRAELSSPTEVTIVTIG